MEFKTDNSLKEQSIEFEPMKFIFGYWKFMPVTKKTSKVEYAVLVLPGGNLHSVLFNPSAVDVPWKTIHNMERALQTGKYKAHRVDFIENY